MIDPKTGKNIVAAPQAPAVAPPILRTVQRNIGAPQALPTTPAVMPTPPATTSHGAFLTDPSTSQPYGPQAGWSPAFQKFGQDVTQGLVAPALTPTQPPPSQGGGAGRGGLVPAAQAGATTISLVAPKSFTDPAGNVRSFADPGSADAAATRLQSPEGVAGLRNEILQRSFDPAKGPGTPEELAFAGAALPGPTQRVSLAAPAIGSPTPPPSPARGEGAEQVDVIRGTKVSRAGGGRGALLAAPEGESYDILANIDRHRNEPMTAQQQQQVDWDNELQIETGGGGSAVERLREAWAEQIMGATTAGVAPDANTLAMMKGLSGLPQEKAATPARVLSRSQVEGQLLQQMNPDALTERDRLVLGKGGAPVAPKLYSKPEYDQYGMKSGEVPYLYDAEGNARPLNFAAPAAGSAGQGQAQAGVPPDGTYNVPGRGRLTVKGGKVYDAKGKEVKDAQAK